MKLLIPLSGVVSRARNRLYYQREVPLSIGEQEEQGNRCSCLTFPCLLSLIIKLCLIRGVSSTL